MRTWIQKASIPSLYLLLGSQTLQLLEGSAGDQTTTPFTHSSHHVLTYTVTQHLMLSSRTDGCTLVSCPDPTVGGTLFEFHTTLVRPHFEYAAPWPV